MRDRARSGELRGGAGLLRDGGHRHVDERDHDAGQQLGGGATPIRRTSVAREAIEPRIAHAFAVFDKDGSGVIEPDDIVDAYDASKHPDVMAGRKTADQVKASRARAVASTPAL